MPSSNATMSDKDGGENRKVTDRGPSGAVVFQRCYCALWADLGGLISVFRLLLL